jgi:Amt family ammonium transporter
MNKAFGLVVLCLLVFSMPAAAWAQDTPSGAAQEAQASAAPATAAPPTEPTVIGADKISAGDTAWMLTSTALVLMMTIPGLALFYGGMVRKKNVLATLMQSFAITCVVTLLWWLIGYSWAFTPGSPYLGGSSRALFNGMTFMKDANKLTVSHLAPTIPETVYAMFQLTFAIITPALIAGAFAERMKFSSLCTRRSPIGFGSRPAGWPSREFSITPAVRWCISMRELRDSPVVWFWASAWGTAKSPCRRIT